MSRSGKNQFTNPWRDWEDKIIIENNHLMDKEISKLLLNRTSNSVKLRRHRLRIPKDNPYGVNLIWSENEDEIVKDWNSDNFSITLLSALKICVLVKCNYND